MEILQKLETKIRETVREINLLRKKVQELEDIKAYYELKTQEMLEEMDLLDLLEEAEENEASGDEESYDNEQSQESGSNIFSPSL